MLKNGENNISQRQGAPARNNEWKWGDVKVEDTYIANFSHQGAPLARHALYQCFICRGASAACNAT